MAKTAGKVGAIYYRKARIQAITIAFNDNDPAADTITDSGNGLVEAGFDAGMHITVDGSTSNDGTYLIDSIVAGTITLDSADTLTDEAAGDTVTIVEAVPGTEVASFYDWTLDDGADIADVTTFGSNGWREYVGTLRTWTATADRYWVSDQSIDDWLGAKLLVRFFTRYDDAPNTTTVWYYEGYALITGISVTANIGEVVSQTVSFQGTPRATIQGTGIAFHENTPSADTITDSGNGFLSAGFEAGEKISVTGSASNDGNYTIDTLTAGTITLIATDDLADEAAGAVVSISTALALKERSTAWPTGGS